MRLRLFALAAAASIATSAGAQQLGTPPAPAQGTFGATPQAQQSQQEAPPSGGQQLQTGEVVTEQTAPGQLYVRESHGDWQVVCIKADSGAEPCQIRQTLFDEQRNAAVLLNPTECSALRWRQRDALRAAM